MSETSSERRPPAPLRQEAERRWQAERACRGPLAGRDPAADLHELEVHQIELEITNEELLRIQAELIEALDLYDFTPVGYLTLDVHRVIRRANLTAATMLGMERSLLLGNRMEQFVARESRDSLYLHLQNMRAGTGSLACSLPMRRLDGSPFFARLETIAVAPANGPGAYRVALLDVTALHDAEEDLRRLNEELDERVQKRTESLAVLHDIASLANRTQGLRQAFEYCLSRLTLHGGWSIAHALLPCGEDAGALKLAYAWYPPGSERFARFREATTGASHGGGAHRHVIAARAPLWTNDLRQDLSPARAALAEELGLRTAAIVPVLFGDKVAAVLEFFSDRVLQPDRQMSDVMSNACIQLGRVMERASFEERLLAIADEMQRHVAEELHDDLGQELTGLGLKAETLAEALHGGKPAISELAADVSATAERVRDKVRALSRRVLPVELETGGLFDALRLLSAVTADGHRVACSFDNEIPGAVIEGRAATHLYRIAQESVANAVRHGRAANIRITLGRAIANPRRQRAN